MTEKDWKRLDELFSISVEQITIKEEQEREALFEMTKDVDEHPGEWDSPCLCQLCCSYGD